MSVGGTRIEWADATWNPVTGCTKVSPGCDNCYAETFAERWRGVPGHPFEQGFDVKLWPGRLGDPLKRRKPTRIFVCSMADLFHKDVPGGFIAHVFAAMAVSTRHTFMVLTKRPARMRALLSDQEFRAQVVAESDVLAGPPYEWPLPNVMLGVSVEDQERADQRVPLLLDTPAAVRFLSCEPLLGPVDLRRWFGYNSPPDGEYCARSAEDQQIRWVIVGGESGAKARPMHPEWAQTLRDQSVDAGVPFFFKQWGEWVSPQHIDIAGYDDVEADERGSVVDSGGAGDAEIMWRVGKKAAGRWLDGRTWDERPELAMAP